MKRLIQRQQVINCGAETCGRCRFIDRINDTCRFFQEDIQCMHVKLAAGVRVRWLRCYQCKNAEVRKP
jgi:hypothetical protein